MKSVRKSTWQILLLTLIGVVIFMIACEKDPTEPADSPVIPPISTFLLDLSAFPDTNTTLITKTTDTQTNGNWGWSYLNAFLWNAVIVVHAAIPVAAYVEAFNHIPEEQEDGSWLWTYDVTVGSAVYTAKLYASTDSEGFNWDMYLSKAGDFTDFHWYTGQHNLLYTEGTWTLYKDPDNPVEFIDIVWHRNLQDSTADIKYINVEPETPGNGGYIFYGTVVDTTYDAFYDLFFANLDHYIDIEWNLDEHYGRVLDSLYFEDALWHCWDENLEDIDCE